ncbi:MAG: YggS family pyridoxal phosphate-dependent enzyme [Gemmataceae bacterium]
MTPAELRSRLADNLRAVEEHIAAACARSGRLRDDVTLVAVTKSVGVEIAAMLPELGVVDLGESRPQELWRKASALPTDVRWHLIGHLQRNKIEKTLPLVHLIHSVDSERLLGALDHEAGKLGRIASVLLEVKLSREAAKTGLPTDVLPAVVQRLPAFKNISVRGLMTMAALEGDPRATFAELRNWATRLSGPQSMSELSMGMTNDFEVAVEEGATLVRIGSALFEGLPES